MFPFSLTCAVRMSLAAPCHIGISPAEDGSLQGLTLEREDGVKLHIMHKKVTARFMNCYAALPEGMEGEPISGFFSLEEAYNLAADFIAGVPMIYDDTHWAESLTPEEIERRGANNE